MSFKNADGKQIVLDIIQIIQDNKDYLSDIDGAIGDGDHGINMNKGASIAKEEIKNDTCMSEALSSLSSVLMNKIGGSMGPLYGSIFMGMQFASINHEDITGDIVGSMLQQAYDNINMISTAKPGDKTLVDVLDPCVHSYQSTYEETKDMKMALCACKKAANEGMLATKDMQAKLGRASRLGEKSIGHQDAGATSCCLIITALCDGILALDK